MELTINLIKDPAIQRLFEELPKKAAERVLKPLMRQASQLIAAEVKAAAPAETGLLRQALGPTSVKTYGSKLFVTVGVRRGFRRTASVNSRGKVKIDRKSRPEKGDYNARNPTQYLHLVERGRKEVHAQDAKVLFSSMSQQTYGTRSPAVPAKPFMSQTFAACAPRVIDLMQSRATDLILAEAAK